MRFKLLRGIHSQREPSKSGSKCEVCNGTTKVEVPGKRGEWPCPSCLGTGLVYVNTIYDAKDPNRSIVVSPINLEERFGSEKFQNLDRLTPTPDNQPLLDKIAQLEKEIQELRGDDPQPADSEEDFSLMSTKQLREYARNAGVDISGASTKDEIINVLESALAAQ